MDGAVTSGYRTADEVARRALRRDVPAGVTSAPAGYEHQMTFWEGRRPSWSRLHKPDAVEVADWAQHAKTALAGVIAWVIATDVLGLEQPFLAPWAAVLVVHATVYRTVSRGGQQIARDLPRRPARLGVRHAVRCRAPRHGRDARRGVPRRAAPVAGGGGDDGRDHRDRRTRHATRSTSRTCWPVGCWTPRSAWSSGWPSTSSCGHRCATGPRGRYAHQLPATPRRHPRADGDRPRRPGPRPRLRTTSRPGCAAVARSTSTSTTPGACSARRRRAAGFNPRRSQPDDLEEMRRALHLLEEAVAEAISLARTIGTSAKDANVWDDSFRTEVQRPARQVRDGDRRRETRPRWRRCATPWADWSASCRPRRSPGRTGTSTAVSLVSLRNIVDAGIELAPWTRQAGSSLRRRARYDLPGPVRRRPHLSVGRRG